MLFCYNWFIQKERRFSVAKKYRLSNLTLDNADDAVDMMVFVTLALNTAVGFIADFAKCLIKNLSQLFGELWR